MTILNELLTLDRYLCSLLFHDFEMLYVINGDVLNKNSHNGIKVIFDIDIQTGRLTVKDAKDTK